MEKLIGIPVETFQRKPYTAPVRPPMPEGEGPGGPGGPGGEGPGGPGGPGADPPTRNAVIIRDGGIGAGSALELCEFEEISGEHVSGIKMTCTDGCTGGILATGEGTDVVVEDVKLRLSGDGFGLGGAISGASVENGAKLTLRRADIVMDGKLRSATSCAQNSVLKVYDSTLVSHGQPWDERNQEVTLVAGPGMDKPMIYLEIQGNTRTHCTVMDSETYFYNSTIVADAWAALSTDAGGNRVYLEANDCHVYTTRYGYGTYADTHCYVTLNRCDMTLANMAAIIAGESGVELNDCYAKCGSYIALIHCVGGSDTEVSACTVRGGQYVTQDVAVIVKSENTDILFDHAQVKSYQGLLVKSRLNDDPGATKAGPDVYGIHVTLKDMDTDNGIAHGDPERRMVVHFENSALRGPITGGAILTFDGASKWTATADSDVVLMGEAALEQIDAPVGVTITARAAAAGEFALASGGKLVLKA